MKLTLADINRMVFEDDAPSSSQIVTAAELADWLGFNVRTIGDYSAKGIIPVRPDGRFDLKPAIKAFVLDLRKGKTPTTSTLVSNPELNAEKIRLNREMADKTAILNVRYRGELVPVADVRAEWTGIVTDLRAALLAVPARVAAATGLDRQAAAALDAELRAAMEAIASDGAQDFVGIAHTAESPPDHTEGAPKPKGRQRAVSEGPIRDR